jgi:two-component system response regulator DegU
MVADEASLIQAVERLDPDLIVTDLSLPVSKEVNVVRQLMKTFPGTKIIVLSVHDEGTAVSECLEAGAVGFVLKRAAVDDLVHAIEIVRSGGIYVSPSALKSG